jgi:hypothetical protein
MLLVFFFFLSELHLFPPATLPMQNQIEARNEQDPLSLGTEVATSLAKLDEDTR